MNDLSEQVRLRPIEKSDLGKIVEWLSRKEVADSIILNKTITYEDELAWYENYLRDNKKRVFAIEVNGHHVGNVSLFNIDVFHGRALMTIFIGEEKYRGRGIGAEAMRQLFEIAFRQMSLRRVGLEVLSDNLKAIKCYKKMGMKEEGIQRSYVKLNDRPRDMVLLSILADEYFEIYFPDTKKNKTDYSQHLPEKFGLKEGAAGFPLMILPSVSNVCNSRCVHCWFNANLKLRSRDGVKFMSQGLFRKIVDEVAEYADLKPLIRVTGSGEPFLMPHLVELMNYAAGVRNVRIAVITNGSLMSPEKSVSLLDAGVEAIEISADAADQDTYERIRPGLKFDVLMKNIEFMLAYKARTKSRTKILISFVDNPKVIDPDTVEAFWRKRADNVIRRKYLTYGQISEDGYSPETYLPPDRRVPCPYPFERMAILANGNVTFCNFDVEDGYYMGNVRNQSIKEIWRSENFETWRTSILEKRFEDVPLCKKCNDWKYKSWTHNFFKVLHEADRLSK